MATKELICSDFSDFVFGAATSAYQVEGAYDTDGKGLSNWDTYTLWRANKILDYTNGSVAIDHYHKYKEDVMLMKKLGLKAYRFSISWSRVLPGGRLSAGVNKEGVQFYNDLINLCISQEIEPYVTLFHFELPQSLEDEYQGFLNRKIVQDFTEFADLCFWEFGDRVKYWTTFNEPWTFAHNAYVSGDFPPRHGGAPPLVPAHKPTNSTRSYLGSTGMVMSLPLATPHRCSPKIWKKTSLSRPKLIAAYNAQTDRVDVTPKETDDGKEKEVFPGDAGREPYIAGYHMILAHASAVKLYRERYQACHKGKIGITNMTTWYKARDPNNKVDQEAATRALAFQWGWFMNPIVHGDYPQVMIDAVGKRLPRFTDEDKKLSIENSYDFIGINYYTTYYACMATPEDLANNSKEPTYYTDRKVLTYTEDTTNNKIGDCPGSKWLYIVPEGIKSLLLHTMKDYKNPLIFITENGMSDVNNPSLALFDALKDQRRIQYYKDHLYYTKEAIKEGVNVKGYFLWSLFDNYEWSEGHSSRFGIVYVDYVNRFARYPKNSAIWWMKFLGKTQSEIKQLEENITSDSRKSAHPRDEQSDSVNPKPAKSQFPLRYPRIQ